jgi:hypothetical protein
VRGALVCAAALTSLEALTAGVFARVPLLLGVTSDDGLGAGELEWTMLPPPVTTTSQYQTLLAAHFGEERAADALRAFPAENDAQVKTQLGTISEGLWCAPLHPLTPSRQVWSRDPPPTFTLTLTLTPPPRATSEGHLRGPLVRILTSSNPHFHPRPRPPPPPTGTPLRHVVPPTSSPTTAYQPTSTASRTPASPHTAATSELT